MTYFICCTLTKAVCVFIVKVIKEMISIFPLRTFQLYVATFQQHGVYVSLLDRELLLSRKLLNQGFLVN